MSASTQSLCKVYAPLEEFYMTWPKLQLLKKIHQILCPQRPLIQRGHFCAQKFTSLRQLSKSFSGRFEEEENCSQSYKPWT